MLGWFATQKVDHPLADAKQSRRVVEDLPRDTHKALTEILFWLDSVNSTEGFRLDRRLELIEEFEQAARLPIRKLAQDYLQLRQQKFQEHRVWTTQAEFWRLLAAGYLRCIEGFQADAPGAGAIKAELAVIVCRALAAFGQQLKWLLLRYGPVDPTIWESLGRLYAFAEARQLVDKSVPLSDGAAGTTARAEFLKALMLGAASTESLLPQQIEIVERSIVLFAPYYQLAQSESERSTYLFDIAMRTPPMRAQGARADRGPSMRYFGPGAAYEEMHRLLDLLLAEGVLPSDRNLGGEYESGAIVEVWRHLLQYWSPTPPERGSERRAVNARLTIVHGFQPLSELLAAPVNDAMDMSLSALRSIESWVVVNASDGGFGAVVPATGSDWLQVGALIGLKVQGEEHWGVGVIRPMLREGEQNRRVGIQRLAERIVLLRLAPHGVVVAGNAVRENDAALLLTPKPDAAHRVRIMQASGTFSPSQRLVMRIHSHTFEVEPEALVESNDEYDVASFLVVRKLLDGTF